MDAMGPLVNCIENGHNAQWYGYGTGANL